MGAGSIILNDELKLLALVSQDGQLDLPKGHTQAWDLNDFMAAQRETWEEASIWITEDQVLASITGERMVLFVVEYDPSQPPAIRPSPETGEPEHIGWVWISISEFKDRCLSYIAPYIEELERYEL